MRGRDEQKILDDANNALKELVGHLTDREGELTQNFTDSRNFLQDYPQYFVVYEPNAVSYEHKPVSQLWNEFD